MQCFGRRFLFFFFFDKRAVLLLWLGLALKNVQLIFSKIFFTDKVTFTGSQVKCVAYSYKV